MTVDVTDEMVDVACKAHAPQWDGIDPIIQAYAREQMKGALVAVMEIMFPNAEPLEIAEEDTPQFKMMKEVFDSGRDFESERQRQERQHER